MASLTDQHTRIPEEELAAFKRAFDAYDLNGDGVIDLEELQLGLQGMDGISRRQASVRTLVNSVDTEDNKNGKLSFDTFVKLMRSNELEEFFEKGKRKEKSKTYSLESFYGQTPTPEETTGLIEKKMKELDEELKGIPDKQKAGYMQALEKCPDMVDDHNFKLLFLRCEVFRVKAAAKRYVEYWDKRLELFGSDKAFLPLTLEGALKDDSIALSIGHFQLTGYKDKDGRRIVFADFSAEGSAKYERSSLVRAFWYMIHATLEDSDTQKYGAVCLMRTVSRLSQWDVIASKLMVDASRSALPIRVAAMHMCHPSPIIGVVSRITKVFLGAKLRKRLYILEGSNEDVLETLKGYGISREAVPNFWGGKLVLDHEKWLNERRA
mmetsp:Transcript_7639/g.10882  ORF Transcript_7639/g.10882 Transcript_7639/m.10882 type:complete len:380 (-) Transcript_7639:254-1393(-)